MRWLWAHWELKLVSFAVAVALWTYTSGQVRVERTIEVEITPEQITGLPGDLHATMVTPSQFTVVLSVPTRKVDDLREEVLRPRITVAHERRGSEPVEIAITSRTLGLDSDIRIQRTDPPNLQAVVVQIASIVEATLPTEPPPVVGLPAGLAADVVLDHTQVQIRGLREVVDAASAHRRVRFAPIRLDGIPGDLSAPREERVELRPLPGQPDVVERVLARVTVRPDRIAQATWRVPVAILLPAMALGRWSLAEGDPATDLQVSGPEGAMHGLGASDASAWIDLRGSELLAGPIERPVLVALPAGLVAAPQSLRVTLRPVAAP